jgi:hypothetical protein
LRRQENVSTLGANRKETRKKAFNEKNQNALAELDKTHSSAAHPAAFQISTNGINPLGLGIRLAKLM